jgi:hypothetical protein
MKRKKISRKRVRNWNAENLGRDEDETEGEIRKKRKK